MKLLKVCILLIAFVGIGIYTASHLIKEDRETTNYAYTFVGESENWRAAYTVNGKEVWDKENGVVTYAHDDSDQFVLSFIGDKSIYASIKQLNYSYETSNGGGGGTTYSNELGSPKKAATNRGSSRGGAKIQEDEVIQVTVKWDDFEESFDLYNE
ncbi:MULTISPECIES: hypothetical protein [Paraliobacillus]|uniref:hypothetical protein n=1 Tax=Paraliobacillus TaxID=200903 RepID=UPI000DD47473|nr:MULTISPECIES: hypothetical protein [Paraliobacillus]